MSDFTIEQLEALKEGTTEGPWEATKDDILRAGWEDRLLEKYPWYAEGEWEIEISYMAPSDEFILSNPESVYKPLTDNRADMELVASAPELLDALIAEKRAHQKLRAEVKKQRDEMVQELHQDGVDEEDDLIFTVDWASMQEYGEIKERFYTAQTLTRILEADNG